METITDLLKDLELRGSTLALVETAVEMVVSSISTPSRSERGDLVDGLVPYGAQKKNGSHNHAYNKGEDRTPAQKAADIGRRKS